MRRSADILFVVVLLALPALAQNMVLLMATEPSALPPGALVSHGMTFVGGMIFCWALGRLWRLLRSRFPF